METISCHDDSSTRDNRRNLMRAVEVRLFKPAPEAKAVAEELIETYYPHLLDAKIAYLYRTSCWRKWGRPVEAKAVVVPLPWRQMLEIELALIVNEVIFLSMGEKGKRAVLDHELAHFAIRDDRQGQARAWYIRDHDIREFSEVVLRNNVCASNLKGIACEVYEQLSLLQTVGETVVDVEAVNAVYNKGREIEIIEEEPIQIEELSEEEPG